MSYCHKYERSLFDFDEFEAVRKTHHPFVYDVPLDELMELRVSLRHMRDKERTLARQKRREVRGKADPRGGSFPGSAEQPQKRKQVLSSALKRANREIARRRKFDARAANVEAAQKALATVRAAKFKHHPAADEHAKEGAVPLPSRKRTWVIPGAKVGSISQMNKVSQAVRDARG